MRTKHLINLLADVQVAEFDTCIHLRKLFGLCEKSCNEHALNLAQLEALENQLNNSIQVRNRSFLLNPEAVEVLVQSLNRKGFNFKIPEGDNIRNLLVQVLTCEQEGSQVFAADFIYHMIHKGYEQVLSAAEIQALDAALVLIEDRLDL